MRGRYEELGRIYMDEHNLKIVPDKIPDAQKKELIQVGIASKRKTDIIKIFSAMYDCGMFADADGKPLTNKQKLMDAFGEFLNDDFTAYSTMLSQAKNNNVEGFMKPLKELENAFRSYMNFTVNK